MIAEPRRREILNLVWTEEKAASEIASEFDVTFGAVSQHLSILREARLVSMRKDGNRRLYQADQEALGPYRAILEAMWSDTLQQLSETIEAENQDG